MFGRFNKDYDLGDRVFLSFIRNFADDEQEMGKYTRSGL